jgi:hypothetical protein
MRLRDNFFCVVLPGDDYKETEAAVLSIVDRFVQLLGVHRGSFFRAEFLYATAKVDSKDVVVREPKTVTVFRLKQYDLSAITESLIASFASLSAIEDPGLARALDYCNHAQFLN